MPDPNDVTAQVQALPLNRDQISRLAILLSGNKTSLADGGAPPDQGTNPGAVTSPLAYRPPAMATAPAAPATGASSVMPTLTQPSGAPTAGASTTATTATAPTLPAVPIHKPVDFSARQAKQDAYNQANKPVDPNDPSVRPHLMDRIFGGMTTFGAALQHNPNAVELGRDITGKRYNSALAYRSQRSDAAKADLDQFDQNTAQQDKDYQQQLDQFGADIKRSQEGRMQDEMGPLNEQRRATANVKNYKAMNPEQRAAEVPNIEKALGGKLDDQERRYFIINAELPKPEKEGRTTPKSPAEGLFSDDPKVKAQAEKWFSYEHRDKMADRPEKGGTPGQFEQVEKQKQDALNLLEEGDAAKGIVGYKQQLKQYQNATGEDGKPLSDAAKKALIDGLNAEHEQKKQSVQDGYESKVRALGGKAGASSVAQPTTAPNKSANKSAAQVAPVAKPTQSGTQPQFFAGDKLSFEGKPVVISEVRRNPQTGEHAYNIGGKWYSDSQLTSAKK